MEHGGGLSLNRRSRPGLHFAQTVHVGHPRILAGVVQPVHRHCKEKEESFLENSLEFLGSFLEFF